jgi:archaellum biogenesis protein FlaJ (TadC family)
MAKSMGQIPRASTMTNPKKVFSFYTALGLSAGLVIANAIVMPLISDRTPLAGLCIGAIAAFLILLLYAFIAIVRNCCGTKS